MCLNKTDFVMQWDRNIKDYVGYGYKKLSSTIYPKYKRWKEAKGEFNCENLGITIPSTLGNRYHPGFHIFLNKEDAQNYWGSTGDVIKVKFRGVLAYGDNEVKSIQTEPWYDYGPCIIARYMKLVEVVKVE